MNAPVRVAPNVERRPVDWVENPYPVRHTELPELLSEERVAGRSRGDCLVEQALDGPVGLRDRTAIGLGGGLDPGFEVFQSKLGCAI